MAPMVRLGTLPLRRLAVQFGADMVYSEEIIDKKIATCTRQDNTATSGTIDFLNPNGKGPVLRTYKGEPLVFQVGTASGPAALLGAQVVANDVRAIDVNMGCPKHFSIQGGMGASLLSDPARAADILKTLSNNLPIPVTCKVRLLDDTKKTIELLQILEKCNVSAIAVHARRIPDRPRHAPIRDDFPLIVSSVQVPIIYNGVYVCDFCVFFFLLCPFLFQVNVVFSFVYPLALSLRRGRVLLLGL